MAGKKAAATEPRGGLGYPDCRQERKDPRIPSCTTTVIHFIKPSSRFVFGFAARDKS